MESMVVYSMNGSILSSPLFAGYEKISEIENLQKEDDNKAKIAVEQLQLGTQKIK